MRWRRRVAELERELLHHIQDVHHEQNELWRDHLVKNHDAPPIEWSQPIPSRTEDTDDPGPIATAPLMRKVDVEAIERTIRSSRTEDTEEEI